MTTFSDKLLAWYQQSGRKHLPWQNPRSPYFVWLSEIMLQQTQVNTVIPYFEKFVQRFPDIATLAGASQDEVLSYWAGLGYYSRARNLHRSAQLIQLQYQGEFPQELELIQQLPGIGRSTAGAILAQAFNRFGVILDGNVKRVLCRYYAIAENPEQRETQKILWQLAEQNTPKEQLVDYTQAIMDLGALVCTRSKPKCALCPLQQDCQAFQTHMTDAYPAKKNRKTLPNQERFFLIVLNAQNEVLLEQRPAPGIWGGLWCLPSVEQSPTFVEQSLAEVNHTFSHFKLKLKPVIVRSEASKQLKVAEGIPQRWVALEQLADIGLPAPIKKILQQFALCCARGD